MTMEPSQWSNAPRPSTPLGGVLACRRARLRTYRSFGRSTPAPRSLWISAALAVWLALRGGAIHAETEKPEGIRPALSQGHLGLYEAREFREVVSSPEVGQPRTAFWLFSGEPIAVPESSAANMPTLVWTGSPEVAEHAVLSANGRSIKLRDKEVPLEIVPRLASNRSYYNDRSTEYLSGQPLRMRGRYSGEPSPHFTARTAWPEAWRIEVGEVHPLGENESLASLIEADSDGAVARYVMRTLWKRTPAKPTRYSASSAVLGFVLNGAQGDDDEAHAGHFAVLTGWMDTDGSIANWMVNNFYDLATVSEKGIIASMIPLDAYLTDFNSGQSWYRPSYLLIAVLDDPEPAQKIQTAMVGAFDRFYRQDLVYDHARANCAGISVDTLAGLGWAIPHRGPTSHLRAVGGFLYSSFADKNLNSGRRTYRYLTEEQVRLFPRLAFETLGSDLLRTASLQREAATDYERLLQDHIEAFVFVRIPQLPSSRAMGSPPVGSFQEYRQRVPSDRRKWKVSQSAVRTLPIRNR